MPKSKVPKAMEKGMQTVTAQTSNIIGKYGLIAGVVIAILIGLFGVGSTALLWVLVVLGLLIGLLNIKGGEEIPFLIAVTVLVIVSYMSKGALEPIGLEPVLDAIMALIVPAAIIVALKEVFAVA